MKTTQLRRYSLVDGQYDDFVAWWQATMKVVRPAAGFTIEFAYGIRETNEFIWAVSAEGDEAAFLALETEYRASDARAAAFDGVPDRLTGMDVRFVESF
ncbi:hypothetical protein ACFC3F_14315 [Microbacterium sp. NPDC055910]|uniref:hypothetical protein n=1 Tax=Microbacterium sp. NPDC055910 TaxID=3345659 RepID=UPI0035DA8792